MECADSLNQQDRVSRVTQQEKGTFEHEEQQNAFYTLDNIFSTQGLVLGKADELDLGR